MNAVYTELERESGSDTEGGVSQVMADALLETGDVTGEYINLQNRLMGACGAERNRIIKQQQKIGPDVNLDLLFKAMPHLFHVNEVDNGEHGKGYKIHNIKCRGELWDITWSQALMNQGEPMTLSQAQDHIQEQGEDYPWRVASAPTYMHSLLCLAENIDHAIPAQKELVKKVLEMHTADFKRDYYMLTSSRNIPKPKDRETGLVRHVYGCHEPNLEVEGNVYDIWNEKVTNKHKDQMHALFLTSYVKRIQERIKQATNKEPYLWTPNRTSCSIDEERAVVLDVDGFDVSASDFINDVRPARGVVATRAKFMR